MSTKSWLGLKPVSAGNLGIFGIDTRRGSHKERMVSIAGILGVTTKVIVVQGGFNALIPDVSRRQSMGLGKAATMADSP